MYSFALDRDSSAASVSSTSSARRRYARGTLDAKNSRTGSSSLNTFGSSLARVATALNKFSTRGYTPCSASLRRPGRPAPNSLSNFRSWLIATLKRLTLSLLFPYSAAARGTLTKASPPSLTTRSTKEYRSSSSSAWTTSNLSVRGRSDTASTATSGTETRQLLNSKKTRCPPGLSDRKVRSNKARSMPPREATTRRGFTALRSLATSPSRTLITYG